MISILNQSSFEFRTIALYLTVLSGFIFLQATTHQQLTASQQAYALCDSGIACLEQGDIENAYRLVSRALELSADSPRVLISMGRVLLEMPGKIDQAIDHFERANYLVPTSPAGHYYMALAYLKKATRSISPGSHAREAQKELDLVIQLDPSHPDAYYQLGVIHIDIFEDPNSAISAFNNQVAANPGHLDAYTYLLKTQIDIGDWDRAVKTAVELLKRDTNAEEVYPYLAGAYWKAGEYESSMQTFERYFSIVDQDELNLYFDLGLILTPEEINMYKALDEVGRQNFRNQYWAKRDPDPKTFVNERLLEHFIRVAWARIQFGQKEWPWDARGDFYVRYGEPDYRSGRGKLVAWDFVAGDLEWARKKRDFQEEMGMPFALAEVSLFDSDAWIVPGHLDKRLVVSIAESMKFENPMGALAGIWEEAIAEAEARSLRYETMATPERWVYKSKGIDIDFEDYTHSGTFTVGGIRSRILVEQMEERFPTVSPEEDKIVVFNPLQSAVTFRGETGNTALEYAVGLLPDDIGEFRSLTGDYAFIDARLELFTTSWKPVANAIDTVSHMKLRPQITIRGNPIFVHGTRVEVIPGEYIFSTLIMDTETGTRSSSEERVILPDYSGDQLMVSDILPAARITEVGPGAVGRFIRGGLELIPLPGRNIGKDQPLYIYFEIYNLTKDAFGGTRYRIEYAVSESTSDVALIGRIYQGFKDIIGIGRSRAVLSSEFDRTDIRSDINSHLEIDMSALPHGVYDLVVSITDHVSGQTASSMLTFRTLPAIPR